jgi:hypothetical protein
MPLTISQGRANRMTHAAPLRRPRTVRAVFAMLLIAGAAPAADHPASPAASTALDQCELYPLAVGTLWIYQSGPLVVREKVARHETMQGEMCARVETLYEDRVVAFEHIAVREDGVYRVAVSGKPVEPPLKFLSLPARPGVKWTVASAVAGKSIRGEFVASEGSFHARSQRGDRDQSFPTHRVTGDNFQAGEHSVSFTYDFVPQLGKVRQVAKTAGVETTIELKEFVPASQTPTRTAAGGRDLFR